MKKLTDFKLLQPENIFDISFTNEVSKLDKSTDSNKAQSLNKEFIFVIVDVLKYNRFTEFNELHPENIEEISFNSDVFK